MSRCIGIDLGSKRVGLALSDKLNMIASPYKTLIFKDEQDLLNQLKIGGKMVAPVGVGDIQVMQLIEKIDEKNIKTTEHGNFSFVPMLNDKNH